MMTHEQKIEQMELSLEEAQKKVDLAAWLQKLKTNREFKKVFLDELFKKEPVRVTAALADPATASYRDDLIAVLDMIGKLQLWIRATIAEGEQAETAIREYREEIDIIRAEELEEDA